MEIVRRLAIVTLTKYAQLVKLAVTTNALMTGLASKTLKECVWKTYALLKIKMILAQVLQITVTRLISNVPLLSYVTTTKVVKKLTTAAKIEFVLNVLQMLPSALTLTHASQTQIFAKKMLVT
jgi:uncharacterized membrane protein